MDSCPTSRGLCEFQNSFDLPANAGNLILPVYMLIAHADLESEWAVGNTGATMVRDNFGLVHRGNCALVDGVHLRGGAIPRNATYFKETAVAQCSLQRRMT